MDDHGGVHSKMVREIMEEQKVCVRACVRVCAADARAPPLTRSCSPPRCVQERDERPAEKRGGGIRLGRIRRQRDGGSGIDVRELRVAVQKLCSSANPLGKCMVSARARA